MAIVPIVILCLYPSNLDRATVGGVLIVFLVFCFGLFCYQWVKGQMRRVALHIGRNSLVLLVFSPIFTVLSKLYQPYLAFDRSGLLFLVVSVIFALLGCFGMGWAMDRTGFSRYFFGKRCIN